MRLARLISFLLLGVSLAPGQAVINGARVMPEISAPSNPAANNLAVYACDDGGTTKLCSKDSAGTVSMGLGGGGGGAGLSRTAYASLPATCTADADLWFCSDTGCVYDAYCSAPNTWSFYHGSYAVTRPPTAGWSDLNMAEGTTFTQALGTMDLVDDAVAGAERLHGKYRTAPSTPYTITAMVRMNVGITNTDNMAGLFFRQSSDGKINVIRIIKRVSGAIEACSTTFSSAIAPVADLRCVSLDNTYTGGLLWLRIGDDGTTNRTMAICTTETQCLTFDVQPRTTYLTADEWGIFVSGGGTTANGDYASLQVISIKGL